MAAVEIREPDRLTHGPVVTVLPPREGFSPLAVGAIGLLVHRLGQPGDIVVGQLCPDPGFPDRTFVAAEPPWWPPFGRVDRYMAGVARTLAKMRPALVEVHNRANLAARIARGMPRTPVVLFIHNDPQGMRQARSPAERAALLRRLTVVCVSRTLANRFMEQLDPAGPAPLVLPNALDLSALPERLPPAARDRTILFVGRVVADKGADAFVDACTSALSSLPGWRARMIGADRFGAPGHQTPFERALAPKAQAAGVAQTGYRPHADVLAEMARAAIVVVPSRWPEPFGLTALEAMASGAALICSPRGALPEVVGDAALFADPDEPSALQNAITTLAQDEDLRASLAEKGLNRARDYDATQARHRLVELRARLLGT